MDRNGGGLPEFCSFRSTLLLRYEMQLFSCRCLRQETGLNTFWVVDSLSQGYCFPSPIPSFPLPLSLQMMVLCRTMFFSPSEVAPTQDCHLWPLEPPSLFQLIAQWPALGSTKSMTDSHHFFTLGAPSSFWSLYPLSSPCNILSPLWHASSQWFGWLGVFTDLCTILIS